MRRNTLRTCAIVVLAILPIATALAQERFVAPPSPRTVYNFNIGWRFFHPAHSGDDIPGFAAIDFDDSAWQTVSTPHTWNDVDSFRLLISHSGGDRGSSKGLGFYRKHFRLPNSAAGNKVFLEFEGMRQAGEI